MPKKITNSNEFQQAISSSNLSVVHFSADWIEQCQAVNNALDGFVSIMKEEKRPVEFYECLAENNADMSLKYNIEAAPTVILFRNGVEVDRVNGADSNQVLKKMRTLQTVVVTEKNLHDGDDVGKSLNDRLKAVINKHKVMIFMKGNREQPRCGFSKTLIGIINATKVDYETFDILEDEEVRQGLKTYSNWPTYPQLYVNGELIGGLDIIKEIEASGELVDTLNG